MRVVLAFGCLLGGGWLALANEPGGEPGSAPGGAAGEAEVPAAVKTRTLAAATLAQSFTGVANVIAPDALIQIDSDIRAASIAADFSRREYERYKSTKSLSVHIIESAERQSETAEAQLAASLLRLRQTWGDAAPFVKDEPRQKILEDLTSGRHVLVRLDFPGPRGEQPKNIRVAPLSGGTETPVKMVWPAPAGNAAMPGISYFAILESGPGLRHQDRARAIAESTTAQSGVIIPEAALVVTAGDTWCYVETAPEKYERRKVPLTWPVAEGYLVESGFASGTKVVVRGASTLLSREAEPGGDEDDEGGAAKAKPQHDKDPEAGERPVPQAATPAGQHDATTGKVDDDDKPAEKSGSAATGEKKSAGARDKAGDDDEGSRKDKAGKEQKKKTSTAPVTGSTSPAQAH